VAPWSYDGVQKERTLGSTAQGILRSACQKGKKGERCQNRTLSKKRKRSDQKKKIFIGTRSGQARNNEEVAVI